MSYVNQTNFAPTNGIRELSFDEVSYVSGADRGDATAGGAVVGASTVALAMTTARYASFGARFGIVGGAAGVIGGAIIGGAIGFVAYQIGR